MGKDNTKNKLIDLNNHLFEQMERLNDEDLTSDELKLELARAKAMSQVAGNIIENARLALDGAKAINEYRIIKPPAMLGMSGCDDAE